jgi:hypothetical protein
VKTELHAVGLDVPDALRQYCTHCAFCGHFEGKDYSLCKKLAEQNSESLIFQ